MKKKVNVFLPMRAGSERVPGKNTKNFAGIEGGLCRIKLEQLLKCDLIEKIIVSTDDNEVINISNSFNSSKIEIVLRPSALASSFASTDDLIKYVPNIMPDGPILWTHVTSPFVDSEIYSKCIETYFQNLCFFDSLMTTTKLQKFIWNKNKPVSYNRNIEKWPRTQTIEPLYEVNGGVFITSKEIYKTCKDRIGNKPFLFQIDEQCAYDIDWLPNFKVAETLFYTLYGSYREGFENTKKIIYKNNKTYVFAD